MRTFDNTTAFIEGRDFVERIEELGNSGYHSEPGEYDEDQEEYDTLVNVQRQAIRANRDAWPDGIDLVRWLHFSDFMPGEEGANPFDFPRVTFDGTSYLLVPISYRESAA